MRVFMPRLVPDGTTLEQSGLNIRVKDGGISKAKLFSVSKTTSLSCGSYSTSSTSYTDVTNLNVTISVIGTRYVVLALKWSGTGTGYIGTSDAGSTGQATWRVQRSGPDGTTTISTGIMGGSLNLFTIPPAWTFPDNPTVAGDYTYAIQVKCDTAASCEFNELVLQAWEL